MYFLARFQHHTGSAKSVFPISEVTWKLNKADTYGKQLGAHFPSHSKSKIGSLRKHSFTFTFSASKLGQVSHSECKGFPRHSAKQKELTINERINWECDLAVSQNRDSSSPNMEDPNPSCAQR